MKLRKRNAFTLIELIATLVIMAIIALIATPLVMNVIRSARTASDKRSIDAYGRSIELAIASHLLDTGRFATSIDELTIEYSGNQVECETTQINPDSSVYLSNCKVNNREVTNYTYGTDKSPSYESYQIGDHVSYNGVNYYVIEDSDTKNNVVKLLKEEPLKPSDLEGITFDGFTLGESNDYTTVAYGTSTDYNTSYVKQVVDAWVNDKIIKKDFKEAKMITYNEFDRLGYEWKQTCDTCGMGYVQTENTPDWVYNSEYDYWTSSVVNDSSENLWIVGKDGNFFNMSIIMGVPFSIRPVVELYKTTTITKLES